MKRTKNYLFLKSIAEKALMFSNFKLAYSYFNILYDLAKYHSDYYLCAKAKEGIASSLHLYDLIKTYLKDLKKFNIKDLLYSEDTEDYLQGSLNYFKKAKNLEGYLLLLYKFMHYYMLYEPKLKNLLEFEKKILNEIQNNKLINNNPEYQIFLYMKLKCVFEFIKFRRKSIFYVYMVSIFFLIKFFYNYFL